MLWCIGEDNEGLREITPYFGLRSSSGIVIYRHMATKLFCGENGRQLRSLRQPGKDKIGKEVINFVVATHGREATEIEKPIG